MTDTPSPTDETLEATSAGQGGRSGAGAAELTRGAVVGRYVVLNKLGAGGMGVVYAAYDPELDRKVALKLLHAQQSDQSRATEGHKRLLREAQALAKLAHPNVVAVHDVGEHAGRVFLAMEFVEGQTLGEWLKKARSPKQVVDVFGSAGQGLWAAHEKGLVHRDFKPDNVMVGDDGRVRVMDFGLARSDAGIDAGAKPLADLDDFVQTPGEDALATALTRHGAVLGTPAYMAPEQWLGEPTDARTDQFSFCVTLYEALFGQRPFAGESVAALAFAVTQGKMRPLPSGRNVPGWLRKVVLRGLSTEAAKRWPSMAALLAELARGQARSRLRKVLAGVGVLALLGVGAEGYRRYDVAQRTASCEADGARIEEIWNDEARAGVREGLLATRVSYAETTAQKVMPWLDDQAQAWKEATTQACLDTRVRKAWDEDTLDRATWCLDERRLELAALVTELSRADDQVVQKAVTAAAGLGQVSPCVDETVLGKLPPPPAAEARPAITAVRAELARAGTLLSAGKYADGLEVVRAAREQSRDLGWPPLSAAVREREANLLEGAGSYAEAEEAGLAAYMEAAQASAWDVAAAAATKLAFTVGDKQARHAEGRVWAGHAEVAVAHAGDPLGLREASRLNNLGAVQYSTGSYDEAKALFVRAFAILEQALGPEHPDVAFSLTNLGAVHYSTRSYDEAKALFVRAFAIREQALGPDHPHVAAALSNLGLVHRATGSYDEAKALHARALAIQEKALGPEHPDVASSLDNLGLVHFSTGSYDEAKALHTRALAIWEKALGPEHLAVAYSLTGLAEVALAQSRPAEAVAPAERAVSVREAGDAPPEELAAARFVLAKALWDAPADEGRDRERARTLAVQARDACQTATGQGEGLAEVTAWLTAHGGTP